ncbi:unnamed protein product [Rotaria magnacalcarata]|uniref:Uncharacterized protein n=1 Tax=Rotaria magnacalcarata TaxID=392030 RepID=A0A815NTV8_9BILA|nr:unnamed protein product [Rotaria magnacalcarata]CAF3981678.1 unnamed protein product [Rotaria magnacalcarata]
MLNEEDGKRLESKIPRTTAGRSNTANRHSTSPPPTTNPTATATLPTRDTAVAPPPPTTTNPTVATPS